MVPSYVPIGDKVIKPVAKSLSEPDGDHRGKIEESYAFGREAVTSGFNRCFEKKSGGDVDADGPHKGHTTGNLSAWKEQCGTDVLVKHGWKNNRFHHSV